MVEQAMEQFITSGQLIVNMAGYPFVSINLDSKILKLEQLEDEVKSWGREFQTLGPW